MPVSPTFLLIFYCLAIAGFSLVGGLLPGLIKMTHTRTQVVMSLVSGLMLGVAFYHLLPHSVALMHGPGGVDTVVWWLMIGLIGMLLLLRVFHFHQHDFSREHGVLEDHAHAVAHGHDHGHGPSHVHAHVHNPGHAHDHSHHHHHTSHDHAPASAADHVTPVHGLSWVGLALGLAVHTLIDGVALGAVLRADSPEHGMIGIGVFLAILLHKPLDAMSIVTVMQAGGWSKGARATTNILFALMCPLGAMLFFFGVDVAGESRDHLVAIALAFSAGAFICIALSDLLPEVHFHSHDRGKLTVAFLLGIVIAYAIGSVEPAGAHLGLH